MDGNLLESKRLRQRLCVAVTVISIMLIPYPVGVFAQTQTFPAAEGFEPENLDLNPQAVQPIDGFPAAARAKILRPKSRVLAIGPHPVVAMLSPASSEDTASSAHTGSSADTGTAAEQPAAPQVGFGNVGTNVQQTPTWSNPQATVDVPGDRVAPVRIASVSEALDRRGSVTFRKTPLSEVVFLLSDLWKINIVAGENVSGEVSGTFHDAPLHEVLSAVLTASGYSYRQTGRSLIVLPIDDVGSDDPSFVSETLEMPGGSIDDEETIEAARLLLSDRGQLQKLGTNRLLLVDSRERIDRVRKLFAELAPQRPTEPGEASNQSQLTANNALTETQFHNGIAYFTPQYTEASEMSEPLSTALGDDAVIAVYPEENRIMVKGDREILKLAAEAIQQLDVPRAQVRITALIYDVGLSEIERLGLDWNHGWHSASTRAISPTDETVVYRNALAATSGLISDPSASGAANLALRTLNSTIDAGLFLQALTSDAESKLLADPSITVGDRREASIRIVQRIPIIAADPVENSGVVFTQVQFEDAGVILNVTPRISRDGTIEMKVEPEYSVVVDFIENNPVIDSRTAATTVRVQDGHMFVLGGLRQKTVTEVIRGVPFLKDMKHFGRLFRAHEAQVRESELVVFIKPEVVMPTSMGNPRQERAGCVSSCLLGRVPYAESMPQTPYCRNPNCPNHVPRPRINGGSCDPEMIGGAGVQSEVIMVNPHTVSDTPISPSDVYSPPPDRSAEVELQQQLVDPLRPSAEVTIIRDVDPPIHIEKTRAMH